MQSSDTSTFARVIRQSARRIVSLILGAMALVLLMVMPLVLIRGAVTNWIWAFVFAIVFAVAVYFGIQDFRKGTLATWQGIRSLVLILWLTILIFSLLSLMLNRFGAHYQGFSSEALSHPAGIAYTLLSFYAWQLFELIPGVNVNEAFGWTRPVQNVGFVSGFLLIAFRVVVLYVLLKTFKDWWAKRGIESNRALIRRWFEEVWNQGRAEAIDEMMAADAVNYGLADRAKTIMKGPADFKPFHTMFRGAFPDVKVKVEDTIAEGDLIAARCSVQGRHTGDHLGIDASNAPVEFTGIVIARVKDGMFVESWNNFDFLAMNKQIGVI